jgi:hypothetical protein
MNSIYDKTIKVIKKDIQSDDEYFEDFEEEEEEELGDLEEEEEEEITNEKNELYEEYDIYKVAYLFKNIDLFGYKIYNKCKNDEELKKKKTNAKTG